MTVDFIKFGFVAGEVAPTYYGRADLEKFDLAMAEVENWFVDYHGGLSNVPGSVFVDFIKDDNYPLNLFEFNFSSSIYDKYIILLGRNYIRFIQDGSYVLENARTVNSISMGSSTQFTVNAHGFSTGDWVQVINVGNVGQFINRTFQITVANANTFTVLDTDGNNINSISFPAYTGGMTVGRVYTLASPYNEFQVADVKAHQIRDVVRFTHPTLETRNLRRFSNANWTLAVEGFSNLVPTTQITESFKTTSGVYACAYVVTVVDANGQESLPSDYHFVTNTIDLLNPITEVIDSNTGGDTVPSAISIKFNPVSGADYYKIYRTRIVRRMTSSANEYNLSRSFQLGYVGRSKGASFTDTGIVPDFTITPPINTNPIVPGAIQYINVTSSANFSRDITMTVSDPTGSGFIGYPIVHVNFSQTTGPVVGILILDGGKNYTNPTITLSAAGTFTYTFEISPLSGIFPSVGAVFQQRQIYAGSNNYPLSVYGSKPGKLSDFTTSVVLVASDAFQHEIDSQNFSAIRHIIDTRSGLIVMSAGGIWQMSGGEGRAITATDVQADLNVYTGASEVKPLKIDTDIVYTTNTGGRVNTLAYADQYKLYVPTDISILANHLVRDAKKIINWTYADEPHRLVYAVRNDGVMLLLTMIKDQEVFAWSRRTTRGEYKYVISFDGESETDVYFVVERKLNGRYKKVIERLASRSFETVEDAVFLDCALTLGKNYPNANVEISATSGNAVAITADAAVFNSGQIGHVLRFGDGKARVTAYNSTTSITVKVLRAFNELLHNTNIPRRAKIGEWTLDAEVSTVTGLWHLEGQPVNVLADGNVLKNNVVTNGSVTLPQPASRVAVGLSYKSIGKNLPLNMTQDIIEGKEKRVVNLCLRLHETKGILVGNSLNDLYSPRTELAEVLGETNPIFTGITHVVVDPIWGKDTQSYFVQENPLPATILGYVIGADIGG
jgi:hypothetical protein